MAWSIPYHAGSVFPLDALEQAQKQENTTRLLTLLDPAYNSCQGMSLHRTLALHSSKSSSGETLTEEINTLLLDVISLRRRDYAYCKTTYTEDERHAFVVRSLMHLCNMYQSQRRFTAEEFKEYVREDTPPHCQSFVWKEQQRPRNIGAYWRRGSESSVSSTSSSIYSSSSAASSTSTIASSTSFFAFDKFMPMQRPSTAAPRLEGNATYVPPARRGSREDIMQKTSWR